MADKGKTTSKGEPAGGAAQGTSPVTRKSPGEVRELPPGAFGPELAPKTMKSRAEERISEWLG